MKITKQDIKLSQKKKSYSINCSSKFRDEVTALADARGVNVGELARSVLLILGVEKVNLVEDPGEPNRHDREEVVLKSGASKGRLWKRKPRLQLRMQEGYDAKIIRKALNFALQNGKNVLELDVFDEEKKKKAEIADKENLDLKEENEKLKMLLSVVSFEPLPAGVTSKKEALYVFGFPPHKNPDMPMVKARFRMLATIYHPDSYYGDHIRMSQINQAMKILRLNL